MSTNETDSLKDYHARYPWAKESEARTMAKIARRDGRPRTSSAASNTRGVPITGKKQA